MIARLNYIAKAVIAFAGPAATGLVSLATQWTEVTEDGFVSGAEYQLIAIGVITGLVTWWKANGPKPPPA